MKDRNIYRADEWPHGLMCERCRHVFTEGQPYAEIPEGFIEGRTMLPPSVAEVVGEWIAEVGIVCIPCSMGVPK